MVEIGRIDSEKSQSIVDRTIFEQWQQDNNLFISTRACKKVEQLIKNQNLVIVAGHSGSGKSAIIQHIALKYRSQGWTVKPIYEVRELINDCLLIQIICNRVYECLSP
uniref:Novel STAND NTPase 3 domain-containing protein n=1 Tax=Magallana gigas TaxID=29159 RepID=K1Q8Z4_MAGGI